MASPAAQAVSPLSVRIFDGARQPIAGGADVRLMIVDGNQNRLVWQSFNQPVVSFTLPFHDNFGDNYTVLASAKGYKDVGFSPVKCCPAVDQALDLMLVRKDAAFSFREARWLKLKSRRPDLYALLCAGVDASVAMNRYNQLLEKQPASLAAFLNITAAMSVIHLPDGTPLTYFRELIWETMAPDRFFAYADAQLVKQVKLAASQGHFKEEAGSAIFHAGATCSYKQTLFGEANVQLTFHENPEDCKEIGGITCVKVEPDIDYFKDSAAHALLEVAVNGITGTLTDPKQVYVLRWMAGRRAGIPEFDPLFTLE